ncbi:MAG TPA: spore germination protein [Pseudobacteroides sp.]|uniref:spore germination protein n=1 Tax=Pseudobacteroides sp. TaxID=1968840 RepID=UPI002F9302FB
MFLYKNIFKKILSFISYKEKKDNSFYIPDASEFKKGDQQKNDKGKAIFHRKTKREIKRPIPIDQLDKCETDTLILASEENISNDIELNIQYVEKCFNYPQNSDIIIRRLRVAGKYKAFIFYVDGMVDRFTINNSIVKPLMDSGKFTDAIFEELTDYIIESVIETNQIKKVMTQAAAIKDILSGNTGVYIQGYRYYIICETKGYEKRSVEKPQVEGVVKGAQEAFNENLRTNITLLRRILKNKNLTTEFIDVGKRNNGKCAVVYLDGLINPAIVNEVKRRITGISTDFIIGDGILEQFIEDNPWSIIPSILSTERPDRTASHIIEGKVAILAEGTPFSLIAPVTIVDLLHTPEDSTLRWQYGTLLRLIRFFAVFIATLLPGLYVALTTFHREMIPTDLLIAIAKARENVPFPTIVEVLLMELSFELIREAGIRIPGIIGNTIGIIGALILGQAAVQANLVSPVLIIVIAFTGLGNFAIPDFSLAFGARIMRVFYIFLGSMLGFYGISLGILISLTILVSMKSFGVPMVSTIAPKTGGSKDFVLRWPLWMQEKRPDYLNALDTRRQPKISRLWTKEKAAYNKKKSEKGGGDHE